MKTLISCFSLVVLAACATGSRSLEEGQDLLGPSAEQTNPENAQPPAKKRIPVYVYPHQNIHGDSVSGTWLRMEDPRSR